MLRTPPVGTVRNTFSIDVILVTLIILYSRSLLNELSFSSINHTLQPGSEADVWVGKGQYGTNRRTPRSRSLARNNRLSCLARVRWMGTELMTDKVIPVSTSMRGVTECMPHESNASGAAISSIIRFSRASKTFETTSVESTPLAGQPSSPITGGTSTSQVT